jgi:hypothetical protein
MPRASDANAAPLLSSADIVSSSYSRPASPTPAVDVELGAGGASTGAPPGPLALSPPGANVVVAMEPAAEAVPSQDLQEPLLTAESTFNAVKASAAQLRATFSATNKSNPRDCCKKGDKGCCRHLWNICCFPCSYFPRWSSACTFGLVVLLFVVGSLQMDSMLDVALNKLLRLDHHLEHVNIERDTEGLAPARNVTADKLVEGVETIQDLEAKFEWLKNTFSAPPSPRWDGCVSGGVGPCVEAWYPCDLGTNRYYGELHYGYIAECAVVPMPLFYDRETAETIDVFIKRLRPQTRVPSKAIWVLQGGPGAPSVNMEYLMKKLYTKTDAEIYTMDHRGTGRSTPMTCTAAQSLTPGSIAGTQLDLTQVRRCFAAFDDQFQTPHAHDAFSVTSAAYDLHRAINMFNERRNQVTSVYGVSYGTMLVARYMMVADDIDLKINPDGPPQAELVILDGVCPTSGGERQYGRSNFATWGVDHEQVGKEFFAACGADEFCSRYLGKGDAPYQTVVELHKKVDAGHCPLPDGASSSDRIARVSGDMLTDASLRMLLPAFIYRLDRCNDEDRAFVLTVLSFLKFLQESRNPDIPQDNDDLLKKNIVYSEMYTAAPLDDPWGDLERTRRQNAANHFSDTGIYDFEESLLFADFPSGQHPIAYPHDGYFDKFPDTLSHVLVMNGMLDPQTPWQYGHTQYDGLRLHGGARKWMADIPGATHGVASSGAQECGFLTLVEFLKNPTMDPLAGANCIGHMPPINFGQDAAAIFAELNEHASRDVRNPKLYDFLGSVSREVGSDLFDGKSIETLAMEAYNRNLTQQIDKEKLEGQVVWWSLFALFVLPCCVLFACVVDLRMEKYDRVCCW